MINVNILMSAIGDIERNCSCLERREIERDVENFTKKSLRVCLRVKTELHHFSFKLNCSETTKMQILKACILNCNNCYEKQYKLVIQIIIMEVVKWTTLESVILGRQVHEDLLFQCWRIWSRGENVHIKWCGSIFVSLGTYHLKNLCKNCLKDLSLGR